MNRYKVSLPMFKYTAFVDDEGKTSLKGPGRPMMCEFMEIDATDEGSAVGQFNKRCGIRTTEQEHKVELLSKGKPQEE